MKWKIIYTILVVVVASFSFDQTEEQSPLLLFLDNKMDTFYQNGLILEKALESDVSEEKIKNQYTKFQSGFRQIQFLLEYISEETVKRYYNGPPLLSVEQNIPTVNVLEPKGLQVIDELLYEEQPDKKTILEKVREMNMSIKKTKNVFVRYNLVEADIKMALYKDIIRLYTLQLTGFDTPGSVSGLQNSKQNLIGIQECIRQVFPQHEVLTLVSKECREAEKYLNYNTDFNSFDRVFFYKKHIRPVLQILSSWRPNEREVMARVPNQKYALSFQAEDLFSENFFKKDYFANLPTEMIEDPNVLELGKKLFYDPILSSDSTMSCASCHKPELYFTDGFEKSATNTTGLHGFRNTPTLINAIYTKGFFYDLREEDPSRQIAHVVMDKSEFNTDFMVIMEKLEHQPVYKKQFDKIFPKEKISKYAVTSAITTYVASLTDMNSPFDRFMRNEITSIDSAVIRGFNLFAGKAACATCHFMPSFSGLVPPSYKESESEVLGIPEKWLTNLAMTPDPDPGRIGSGKPRDETEHLLFSFKTTTVRNVAKTSPYMHNGAFKNLEEVMDFYNKGGGNGVGFELKHQTLSSDPLDLTQNEIKDIVRFMESLTTSEVYD